MKITRLKRIFFSVLFALASSVHAQPALDSAVQLKPVVIEQTSLGNYAISKFTLKVDSLTQQLASNGSMADMLRKFGYGHFRGYGPGGLTTASFRGTGSSHTAVLWNGINLLSPLSGQLDLSHVPVSFIDDASIQTGGAASLYGNGSIGATINLNNKARFNEGLKLNSYVSIGSFQSYYRDVGVAWSGKKSISSTKIFLSDAKNDFKYLNEFVYPFKKQTREHTATHQKGLLQQFYWQPSAQHLLTLKFWYQDDSYQVPNPTSIMTEAKAVEVNTYYRTVVGWHFNHKLFDLNYQWAFVKHDLNYKDPLLTLNSTSIFNTSINNLEANFLPFKNSSLTTGVNYTWEQGVADDFAGAVPVRNRIALFSAVKWLPIKTVEIAAAVREEFVNGNTTPVAPSLTGKIKPTKNLSFYASTARNYRIPTFNDLYWRGAGALGNPILKPELSFSREVGFAYNYPFTNSRVHLSINGDVFKSNVQDWIQWTQLQGAIWSPLNVKKVLSRGVEVQTSGGYVGDKVSFELLLKYSFTRSTNEAVYNAVNSNEIHRQLTFTPMHEGSATVRSSWKKYAVNIVTTYTSKQYTDGDNNDLYAIKAYSTSSLWLSKTIDLMTVKASVIGEVNNLFNAIYQSRLGYPMPGRNYKIGIKINLNKLNKV